MKQSYQHSHIMSSGLLLFLLFLALYIWQLRTKKRQAEIMDKPNNTGLKVYQLLLAIGFNPIVAKYITAQAAHETANFQSKIFNTNNNLFGMKFPTKRYTTATSEKNGYAYYNSIENCIEDYKVWWQTRNNSTFDKISDFVESLKKASYFEAPFEEYKAGVTYFYKLYFND